MLSGIGTAVLAYIGFGLCTRGWEFYGVIILSAFGGIAGPALQSHISRQVPASEQGAVNGALSGMSSLAYIAGPLIGTTAFALGLRPGGAHPVPGLPFFVASLLVACAWGVALHSFRRHPGAPLPAASARTVAS